MEPWSPAARVAIGSCTQSPRTRRGMPAKKKSGQGARGEMLKPAAQSWVLVLLLLQQAPSPSVTSVRPVAPWLLRAGAAGVLPPRVDARGSAPGTAGPGAGLAPSLAPFAAGLLSSLSLRASPVTWTSQPCPRSRRGNPPAVCVALFQVFRTGRRDQARDTQTPGAGGREHGCPGACVTPWLPFLLPLARSGAGENYLQWGFTCCFCCGLGPARLPREPRPTCGPGCGPTPPAPEGPQAQGLVVMFKQESCLFPLNFPSSLQQENGLKHSDKGVSQGWPQ